MKHIHFIIYRLKSIIIYCCYYLFIFIFLLVVLIILFKMEGTPTLQNLIRKNNFAISFDLKEAYNHIPVHPTFQNLLRIQFMEITYTYWGMVIREIWRIRCVVYMDNLLLLHPDKNHLAKLAPHITQFLQHYGWTINLEKSHLQPTQQFQYRDSTTMTVQLPPDRHLRILKELRTEDLQKENDFCKNSSNFDWDAFRYKDTIPQDNSLPQMFFHNISYLCQ
jgi:hypothetical protein